MSTIIEKSVEYPLQNASGNTCLVNAWAKVPPSLSNVERQVLLQRCTELIKARGAVLVAHYEPLLPAAAAVQQLELPH